MLLTAGEGGEEESSDAGGSEAHFGQLVENLCGW